ncbi:MAG: hypothetical protein ABIX01_17430 [Chitinophagaceae bacterium]
MVHDSKPAEMMLEVDQLISDGKIPEATDLLNEVLAEAPDYGRAHNHLGWIYDVKLKLLDKAEEHYKLAIKFSPEYASGYTNYAFLLSSQRRFSELEAVLKKAELCPTINRATIANEYGIMYESMGKFDDAIIFYKNNILYTFDNKVIDTAVGNIERCKRKKDLLGNL